MPVFEQQDPLSVAVGALAGYFGQKQQNQQYADQTNYQRQQDALANAVRQRELDIQAQEAAARQQEALARLQLDKQQFALGQRKEGIDPATGKPFVVPGSLQHVAPNNHGKPATLQDEINHKRALAAWYAHQGDTAAAQQYNAEANSALSEWKDRQTVAAAAATLAERIRHDTSLENNQRAQIEVAIQRVQVSLQRNEITAADAAARLSELHQYHQDTLHLRQSGQADTAGYHKAELRLRKEAIDAANARARGAGALRLTTRQGAPSLPTDDPNFNQTLHDFNQLSPAGRDKLINSGKLPASTKAYLQSLGPAVDSYDDEDDSE